MLADFALQLVCGPDAFILMWLGRILLLCSDTLCATTLVVV